MSYKISSLTGKIWNVQNEQKHGDFVKILAENRGIKDLHAFINSSVKSLMPDPFFFIDMEKAVNKIVEAIKQKKKIAIFGDYDVDGVSSVSIFIKFLEHIGAEYAYFIPNRIDEGYGLNIPSIKKYEDCLIIAVDCGSSSRDELSYAKNNNIDVIVIDHHTMSDIPDNTIIVNPHRPDENGNYKYLCATGLVFICIIGVNRLLKNIGFYSGKQEQDLTQYLDLVALATVCDVVDLVELNRAFVSAGIKVIEKRTNFGIEALLVSCKNNNVNTDTISFFLGPRLNAAGRMASADISVKLLTTKNPIEAQKISKHLDELNKKRREIEQKIMNEAMPFAEKYENFICPYNQNWNIGIIGIIAGRLKDKYNKTCIMISCDSHGIGKASCRSVEGVDMSEVVKKGIEQKVIISGGGHSMAAGFTFDMSKINDLLTFLDEEIKYKPSHQELYADCTIPIDMVSHNIVKEISILEPFGMKNRYPMFVIPDVKITSAKIVGENHISFSLNNRVQAISYKSANSPLGDILMRCPESVSVLGTLVISSWNNRVNFQLEDIAS